MLEGYPHRPENSFFQLALEQLRAASVCKIKTSSYTLGGFPITRVIKHLASHCLAENPSIVVIQFATSDLVVPLRRKYHRSNHRISRAARRVSDKPANLMNRLNWLLQGLVGDGLRLKSVTPPEVYLETMREIVQILRVHQIIPVVMSPFVFGGSRSNRIAGECHLKLQEFLYNLPQPASTCLNLPQPASTCLCRCFFRVIQASPASGITCGWCSSLAFRP